MAPSKGSTRLGRPRITAIKAGADPRHEILVAAARLFASHGYHGTQLNQIATASGLRTPSVYYHFPGGKEEIHLTLASFATDSAAFTTEVLAHEGRAAVRLFRMLSTHIQRLTSAPYDLWFLIGLSHQEQAPPAASRSYLAWQKAVMALIEAGVKEGDLRPLDKTFCLEMIIGTVHGALALRHAKKTVHPDEIADFVLRALSVNSDLADEIRMKAREVGD